MKKLFYILMFLCPVVMCAQQSWYKSSPLNYWQTVGSDGFSAGTTQFTSLAFSPSGQPYVAYSDAGNSMKATVMKFNGTNWVNVGNAGFSAGQAEFTSLAFSPSSQPYVAYSDDGNSSKTTVMKFDGANWVNVGQSGFSAGFAIWTSLAFSPSGQPYVAYNDNGNANKETVMKFVGTNWVNVGNAGFSAGGVWNSSLAFSPTTGQPYVAYADFVYNSKATVMKFNGTNWVNVGNAGFSAGKTYSESLAFSQSGEPYLAYVDHETNPNWKATVMKFDGTNWVNVGNQGFSQGEAPDVSLAFSPFGEPYVAFLDSVNFWKATVMKFSGTDWANVGQAGFSTGEVYWLSLAFSPSGQPYIGYNNGGADFGGHTTVMYYNAPAGIMELKSSRISIYPNPANDKITIEISGKTNESNLAIVNIEGQELITRQITAPKTLIDISNLPSGVYFVRLTNDRTVEVGKIIKQ